MIDDVWQCLPEPPCRFQAAFHRPEFYRYLVAQRGFRITPNRYGAAVIGIALVIGRHAYCVKWADARAVSP